MPWGTFIAGSVIVGCACAYILLRYGVIHISPERAKQSYQKPQGTMSLYFADSLGERLSAEQRVITPVSSLEERVARTIEELLKGPRGKLVHTIPSATELRSVRMEKDGVVWLDFSSSLVSAHPGGSSAEIITIYSIVNTVLLNFKELQKVGILVEGRSIDTLAGHLDCSRPFAADTTVIR